MSVCPNQGRNAQEYDSQMRQPLHADTGASRQVCKGRGDGTFSILQTLAMVTLLILWTVLTTTHWSGCCHYSHFSNEELTLRESTEANEDKGATQMFLEL